MQELYSTTGYWMGDQPPNLYTPQLSFTVV